MSSVGLSCPLVWATTAPPLPSALALSREEPREQLATCSCTTGLKKHVHIKPTWFWKHAYQPPTCFQCRYHIPGHREHCLQNNSQVTTNTARAAFQRATATEQADLQCTKNSFLAGCCFPCRYFPSFLVLLVSLLSLQCDDTFTVWAQIYLPLLGTLQWEGRCLLSLLLLSLRLQGRG